jgi:hypothetical protein
VAKRRASARRGTAASWPTGLEAEPFEQQHGVGIEPQGAHGQGGEPGGEHWRVRDVQGLARVAGERPGSTDGGRDRDPRRKAAAAQALRHVAEQRRLAAEQMRGARDVDEQAVRIVGRGPGRPALRPQGEAGERGGVAPGIGGFGDQFGADRARIGQPLAGAEARLPRGRVERGEDEAVRALGDQREGLVGRGCIRRGPIGRARVRRACGPPQPVVHRQVRQEDGDHPLHARRPSGRDEPRAP